MASSGGDQQRPARYPTLTLAEAITFVAYRRYYDSDRLRRMMRGNRGRLPSIRDRLDQAGKKVGGFIQAGLVKTARGFLQDEGAEVAPKAGAIPATMIQDGAYVDALHDTIYTDWMLKAHANGVGYPCYRSVTLNALELQAALSAEASRGPVQDNVKRTEKLHEERSAHPRRKRAPTDRDRREFRAWAQCLKNERGYGPSVAEAERFGAARNIHRDWPREEIKKLPVDLRQPSGGQKRRGKARAP